MALTFGNETPRGEDDHHQLDDLETAAENHSSCFLYGAKAKERKERHGQSRENTAPSSVLSRSLSLSLSLCLCVCVCVCICVVYVCSWFSMQLTTNTWTSSTFCWNTQRAISTRMYVLIAACSSSSLCLVVRRASVSSHCCRLSRRSFL